MKVKKRGMSRVSPGGVNLDDATRERKSGESPNIDMLVPEAIPMNWGKVFVAANTKEKYLYRKRSRPQCGRSGAR